MAGVGNPQIPETALQALPALPTVCAGWNWDTIFLKPTGKMVAQKKRQVPFFPMPMKFFPPDFVLDQKKNKASCTLAESLGMEAVKINSGQTASEWPEGYLLYAEKMQQQPDKENGSRLL